MEMLLGEACDTWPNGLTRWGFCVAALAVREGLDGFLAM